MYVESEERIFACPTCGQLVRLSSWAMRGPAAEYWSDGRWFDSRYSSVKAEGREYCDRNPIVLWRCRSCLRLMELLKPLELFEVVRPSWPHHGYRGSCYREWREAPEEFASAPLVTFEEPIKEFAEGLASGGRDHDHELQIRLAWWRRSNDPFRVGPDDADSPPAASHVALSDGLRALLPLLGDSVEHLMFKAELHRELGDFNEVATQLHQLDQMQLHDWQRKRLQQLGQWAKQQDTRIRQFQTEDEERKPVWYSGP